MAEAMHESYLVHFFKGIHLDQGSENFLEVEKEYKDEPLFKNNQISAIETAIQVANFHALQQDEIDKQKQGNEYVRDLDNLMRYYSMFRRREYALYQALVSLSENK